MPVRVELSILLRQYVPGYDENAGILVDFEDGKTVEHIIAELCIPKEKVIMVLVNQQPSKIGQRIREGDSVRLAMVFGAG
jgi:hypothetical protein